MAAPALMVNVNISKELAEVIGPEPKPRTVVTSKLWEYIKANNLQDPNKKTCINADAKLKVIFDGRDQVTMFEMTKYVNKHLSKIEKPDAK